MLKGQMASGSDRIGWVEPPEEVLLLAKNVCDKGNFDSMAVDIFETINGEFLVNELQAVFGSYIPYQMKINRTPGRFVFQDNTFNFEEGEFHRHGSNLLRVEHFLQKLQGEV